VTRTWLRRDDEGITLVCRVQPRARVSEFAAIRNGAVVVRVAAPPVDGKANEALRRFVARAFAVPASAVSLESGTSGRDKRLRIHGAHEVPDSLRALGLRG
jgi:uncharacterized protein (TIGR00251 family)